MNCQGGSALGSGAPSGPKHSGWNRESSFRVLTSCCGHLTSYRATQRFLDCTTRKWLELTHGSAVLEGTVSHQSWRVTEEHKIEMHYWHGLIGLLDKRMATCRTPTIYRVPYSHDISSFAFDWSPPSPYCAPCAVPHHQRTECTVEFLVFGLQFWELNQQLYFPCGTFNCVSDSSQDACSRGAFCDQSLASGLLPIPPHS